MVVVQRYAIVFLSTCKMQATPANTASHESILIVYHMLVNLSIFVPDFLQLFCLFLHIVLLQPTVLHPKSHLCLVYTPISNRSHAPLNATISQMQR